MAAQRIRAANASGLPRCKSEGTLIDLSEGFSEASFNDVKGELPGTGLGPRARGPPRVTFRSERCRPVNIAMLSVGPGDSDRASSCFCGVWGGWFEFSR